MSWLKRLLPQIRLDGSKKDGTGVPEGVWVQCHSCKASLYGAEFKRILHVCPKCDFHHQLSAAERLAYFLDSEYESQPILGDLAVVDKLKFKDSKRYKDRLIQAKKQTGEEDALVAKVGYLMDKPVVALAFEFKFIGGSMGAMVGETFVKATEYALLKRIPLVCFSASGGARMQEGLISLMQMAKTSAALAKLAKAGIPFISILTHPTMGGVSASFAMLGDIILAEPRALIGFAGPRVIEQTVKEVLPEGFQRSEFLLEHGHIDQIVHRRDLRKRIASLLSKLTEGQVNAKVTQLDDTA